MTDKEKIEDLQKRVRQLELILAIRIEQENSALREQIQELEPPKLKTPKNP